MLIYRSTVHQRDAWTALVGVIVEVRFVSRPGTSSSCCCCRIACSVDPDRSAARRGGNHRGSWSVRLVVRVRSDEDDRRSN